MGDDRADHLQWEIPARRVVDPPARKRPAKRDLRPAYDGQFKVGAWFLFWGGMRGHHHARFYSRHINEVYGQKEFTAGDSQNHEKSIKPRKLS